MRVILDNDWSGDPDGLFQLAHHLLSPSVDVRLVLGSHLRSEEQWPVGDTTAEDATREAQRIIDICGPKGMRAIAGSNFSMKRWDAAADTPAARAIVQEALRDDPRPLYACFGGPLTSIASALLLEPRVADRLTLVWIGGSEYPGAVLPPNPSPVEYNTRADVESAAYIFNHSAVPLWQVPRDAYRQVLMSQAELDLQVRPMGTLGQVLASSIDQFRALISNFGLLPGESYIYGDSPLVLLTALLSEFNPDASSSKYFERPRPSVSDDGMFNFQTAGHPVRVFTRLDSRLLISDFLAKLALFNRRDDTVTSPDL